MIKIRSRALLLALPSPFSGREIRRILASKQSAYEHRTAFITKIKATIYTTITLQ